MVFDRLVWNNKRDKEYQYRETNGKDQSSLKMEFDSIHGAYYVSQHFR